MNEDTHISDAGLALIAQSEGFRTHCYDDSAGFCTVGYGHLVHRGNTGTDPGAEAGFLGGVSETAGLELLRKDVKIAANAVRHLVQVPLLQCQFDALVCLVFNIGGKAFKGSTLLRYLNASNYASAQAQFHRWAFAGGKVVKGLLTRRALEAKLFGGG